MDFFKNISQFLKKPFPIEESFTDTLKIIIGISVFVTLFLYIFQTNGIKEAEHDPLTICLCFGLITFVTSIIYEFFMVKVIKFKGVNFTFGKWIIYFFGVILFISFANFIFSRIVFFGYIKWDVFPHMIRGTMLVGLFPAIFLGAIALIKQEQKYQNIAVEINNKSSNTKTASNSNIPSFFNIPANQIRYIEALQNYVRIGHFNTDGQWLEKTERATLKGILDQAQGSSIVKCHRSYLVNRNTVVSTSGNAQGLVLTLSDCEKTIPVSRSFVPVFRDI